MANAYGGPGEEERPNPMVFGTSMQPKPQDTSGAAVRPQFGAEGGVDPQAAAPSFAGGGAIPDDDDDDDTDNELDSNAGVQDDTTANVSAALNMVNQALMYGRQKHGLPGNSNSQPQQNNSGIPDDSEGEESYAEGGAIADDIEAGRGPADEEQYGRPEVVDDPDAVRPPISGDNLDRTVSAGANEQPFSPGGDNSGAAPVTGGGYAPSSSALGADDSGAVPVMGDGQPATPMQYLQGADAMPEPQAKALETSVASSAGHEPNARTLLATQKAGEMDGPAAAFAYLQRNRRIYDASMSHARAALNGVEGRPPSLDAAVESATKAYTHMPEASDVKFLSNGNGVTASVSDLNSGKRQSYSLTPQQFAQVTDITKDGQFDRVLAAGGMAALLQKMTSGAGTGAQEAARGPYAGPAAPGGEAEALRKTQSDRAVNMGHDVTLLRSPKYDAQNPGAVRRSQNTPERVFKNDTDSSADRAMRAFPMLSQGQQREAFRSRIDTKDADRKAKVEIGEGRVEGAMDRAKFVEGEKTKRAEASQGIRDKYNTAKIDTDLKRIASTAANATAHDKRAALNTIVQAAGGYDRLSPEHKKMVDQLLTQPAAPRAPQPQTPQAPGAQSGPPAPGMKQFNGKWYTREQYQKEYGR